MQKQKKTIDELFLLLKPIIEFDFLTVDNKSLKLWIGKPSWNTKTQSWVGLENKVVCVGMLDIERTLQLSSFIENKQIQYKKIIFSSKDF